MVWNAKALGLAFGTLWGALFLIGTTFALLAGYGTSFFDVWTGVYPGYTVTWLGVLLGTIYGFIDGFIGGWLIAWLYNKFDK